MMSERTSYAPGTPCWVDLGSPDLEASVEFYGGAVRLGGAGAAETPSRPAATAGRRRTASRRRRDDAADAGGPAAGLDHLRLGRRRRRDRGRGQGGRRQRDRRADGRDGPRQDGGLRRPDRRRLRDLAAGHVRRRRLVNEPGAFAWNELNTRDLGGAPRSSTAPSSAGASTTRRWAEAGPTRRSTLGESAGRRHARHGRRGVPDEVPAHWLVYFGSRTPTRRSSRPRRRGGGVMLGPIDIPVGRFAILTDPHGRELRGDRAQREAREQRRARRQALRSSRGRRPLRRGRRPRPRPPIRRAGRGWRS